MDSQGKRKKNIKRKLNIINHLINYRNIILVDDSIVRGNTIKHIIDLLKNNGVNKLFVVSSSHEIINENKYGLDVHNKDDLISYNKKYMFCLCNFFFVKIWKYTVFLLDFFS